LIGPFGILARFEPRLSTTSFVLRNAIIGSTLAAASAERTLQMLTLRPRLATATAETSELRDVVESNGE